MHWMLLAGCVQQFAPVSSADTFILFRGFPAFKNWCGNHWIILYHNWPWSESGVLPESLMGIIRL